jgi:hypothetical protein
MRGLLLIILISWTLFITTKTTSVFLVVDKPLPNDLTLSQLLQVLHQRGLQHGNGLVNFLQNQV